MCLAPPHTVLSPLLLDAHRLPASERSGKSMLKASQTINDNVNIKVGYSGKLKEQ